MKIHEILKNYLDLTSALIDTPEEIESYNILRDLEKRLTPKFEIGDTVRFKESDDSIDDYEIEFQGFELKTLEIYYEDNDVEQYYIDEQLKLIQKGNGVYQYFKIGDKIIARPTDIEGTTLKEIKGTIYQILGEVCYITTRTGELHAINQDYITYNQEEEK